MKRRGSGVLGFLGKALVERIFDSIDTSCIVQLAIGESGHDEVNTQHCQNKSRRAVSRGT